MSTHGNAPTRRRLLTALAAIATVGTPLHVSARQQAAREQVNKQATGKQQTGKQQTVRQQTGKQRSGKQAAKQQAATPRQHATAASSPAGPSYADNPAVRAFAADVAARRDLSRTWIEAQLSKAHRIEAARKLVMPPPVGTPKNWAAYRARFIEPQRIAAGAAFWRDNARWLALAEERWGVPPEIVVGIIGVETFYGRVMGSFRIIDVLATLAFDFPPGRRDRSAFFTSELEAFFVLCAREGDDPQALKGSYAGAIGLPQFMPSSINAHAVDMDGDGHIRLHDDPADVVGSVAHYLAQFGWQRGLPTIYGVLAPADDAQRAALLAPDIVPSFTAEQFAERGALLDETGRAHQGLLALIELQNGLLPNGEDAPRSHVAGTQNFYVVTRYNWSSYYAMAVIDLAAAVKREMAER